MKQLSQPAQAPNPASIATVPPAHFIEAFLALVRRPQRLLFMWNWKSAVLSIVLRGPIFLVASVHRGFRAALAAVLIECAFCAATAGFYGALIQILRNATPEWLTALFLVVGVPGIFQVIEAYLHWSRGTPHWRIAEAVSVVVSAVSALFNWYAMRRGALLVGDEGESFGADVTHLPRLLLSFATLVPRYLSRREKSGSNGSPAASHH